MNLPPDLFEQQEARIDNRWGYLHGRVAHGGSA